MWWHLHAENINTRFTTFNKYHNYFHEWFTQAKHATFPPGCTAGFLGSTTNYPMGDT